MQKQLSNLEAINALDDISAALGEIIARADASAVPPSVMAHIISAYNYSAMAQTAMAAQTITLTYDDLTTENGLTFAEMFPSESSEQWFDDLPNAEESDFFKALGLA